MSEDRRLGKIYVDHDIIDFDRKDVRALMDRIIILRAESLFHSRRIEYIAICEDWPALREGDEVPRYVAEIYNGVTTRVIKWIDDQGNEIPCES